MTIKRLQTIALAALWNVEKEVNINKDYNTKHKKKIMFGSIMASTEEKKRLLTQCFSGAFQ